MQTVEEKWWEKYRKRQAKRLNIEMILRKSVWDTAKEYATHSSLGGVKQIFEKNISPYYRLVWTIVFSLLFGTTCNFLLHTWLDTLTKPLIVTMESSTYPINKINFPAVAICNINRISKKALENFANETYSSLFAHKHNYTLEEVLNFSREVGRLIDYSWLEHLRNHPLLDLVDRDASEMTGQMKKLAPKCEEMILRCGWGGRLVNCSEIFTMRRTVRGHCCAFNFILDYDSAGRPEKTIANSVRQNSSGKFAGLNLILDTQKEDYSYPLNTMVGFDIFLFDPAHYADPSGGRVEHRVLEANTTMMLELASVVQAATDEVRKYPLSTRKCLFRDEKEQFNNMYSFSACLVNCRIRTVQTLCQCTPFFLPSPGVVPTCTLVHLSCLNKYKDTDNYQGLEAEIQDSLYCPECLPDCEFTQHSTRAFKLPSSMKVSSQHEYAHKETLSRFKLNINLMNKCLISIYQATDYGTLDRLDVVSYWFEIVSNIGGFAGIFLGFSFVVTAEVVYFTVIRFLRNLHQNYKDFY